MYLPRNLISHLYLQLVRTQHALSPPVLILSTLEPDALCACRILSALLKRDYIPHKIKPISGYGDLMTAGSDMVQPMRISDGGTGGVVVCLGVGGLVDLGQMLGFDHDENGNVDTDGVEMWILDARRPYNLANVFGSVMQPGDGGEASRKALSGVHEGQVTRIFKTGSGGIVVWDDGDIQEELQPQRAAHFALERMRNDVEQMETVDEDGAGSDSDSDRGSQTSSSHASTGQKRKSWELDPEASDSSEKENTRPNQRRRGNSVSSNVIMCFWINSTHNRPSPTRYLLHHVVR